MKILFACDLDGTLIHSYKKRREDDICVEIYDGREQSFISRRELALLREISTKILFIPVTTRSFEQYRRIFWAKGLKIRYAMVANGAIFLDGEQKTFFQEIIAPYATELEFQCKKYADDENFTICRIVDESFLFLRCRDELNAADFRFETNLTVQCTEKKIYLFPPPLNKGNAVNFLAERFNPDKIICAGDTDIDLPMLKLADVAFIKKNLHDVSRKDFVAFSLAEEFLELISLNLL